MLGSTPSGRLCAEKVASAISPIVTPLSGSPRTENRPGVHSRSSAEASSSPRRDHLGLLDHLVARRDQGHPADRQGPGPVGVHALGRDLGVAVQHPDVLERHAELVGDDLAPRRLVPLAVRAGSGDHLDLAGGQHPDRRVLPAAGAVGERAEHPGRGQPAHLGEGGDADAELHRVVAGPPLLLLLAQRVVAEQLLGPGRGRLVVARVVGQAGDGGERELLVLDPVPLPHAPAGPCPARAASSSIIRSMAKVASGRPAPR